jgi:hypothetical protein
VPPSHGLCSFAKLSKLRYNQGMRRFLYVATFSFILCALPLVAQRHGGGGGMRASSGGGFAGHSSPSHSSGFSHVSSVSHGGNFGRNPGRNPGVHIGGNPNFRRRGFNGRRYVYPYPYAGYYPYLGYYGGYYPYDDQSYDQGDDQTSDAYADSGYQGPYRNDRNEDVSGEVQKLNGKIDRLQADLDARSRPSSNMEPATALVFRDKHVEEIRNYAISGGTLWVFGDQSAKKIPLAQLDLAATAKMNDERGVDFQIPR